VVVVGSGGAGLAAAIQAHDEGARVVIIEKVVFEFAAFQRLFIEQLFAVLDAFQFLKAGFRRVEL
jgi:thioredoxin reductase